MRANSECPKKMTRTGKQYALFRRISEYSISVNVVLTVFEILLFKENQCPLFFDLRIQSNQSYEFSTNHIA